jgi:hypothetical protein
VKFNGIDEAGASEKQRVEDKEQEQGLAAE